MLEIEEQRWLKNQGVFGSDAQEEMTMAGFSRSAKRALGNSLPPRGGGGASDGEWKFALAKKGQQWISSRLCTSLCKFYQNTTRAMFNYINLNSKML